MAGQGQEAELVPASLDEGLSPSLPFHIILLGSPSQGPSLVPQGLAWWSCFPQPALPLVLSYVV